MRGPLKNVQQIQACSSAFAAILADGSVVAWGAAAWGGDSRAVQDQLKNVQQIQASSTAFAAIGQIQPLGLSHAIGPPGRRPYFQNSLDFQEIKNTLNPPTKASPTAGRLFCALLRSRCPRPLASPLPPPGRAEPSAWPLAPWRPPPRQRWELRAPALNPKR